LFTFSIVCLSKLKAESMITPMSLPQLLTEYVCVYRWLKDLQHH
jgi:hypothetical protein